MSQWDKLIAHILATDPNLRFEELCKALERIGYMKSQPRGGSSHYTFRKTGYPSITLPRQIPMNKAYIEMARDAVRQYLEEM